MAEFSSEMTQKDLEDLLTALNRPVTTTELQYLDNVSRGIMQQLDPLWEKKKALRAYKKSYGSTTPQRPKDQ